MITKQNGLTAGNSQPVKKTSDLIVHFMAKLLVQGALQWMH